MSLLGIPFGNLTFRLQILLSGSVFWLEVLDSLTLPPHSVSVWLCSWLLALGHMRGQEMNNKEDKSILS